jgi:chemotaxis protein MotB
MGKKKHAEHVNHERWLVSWADLLTLLFAFFVVMFASSSSDKKKAAKMAAAMQTAFQQPGIFDAHSKTPPLAPGAGASNSTTPIPLEMPIETPDASTGKGDAMSNFVKQQMATAIAPALAQHMVTMRITDEGTILSLDSAGFFDSGSAQVKPSTKDVLKSIAQSLPNSAIRVEGHTDNQPIHTAQFHSNWELSTARAAAIAQVLMQWSANSPANFSIAGYGEFHPIAGNNTAEGRAANRRVDIVLLRIDTHHLETEKPRGISAHEAPPLPFAAKSTS